mmetsp:Transcript_34103/g.74857  ORF Transcript_34103/g.74857 Transcript_34103/m.74857 type:complete len:258 (-) Transcript_34103:336-1109(-)
MLAVEQQEVGERLRRKGRIINEEVELLETCRRLGLHTHQRRIVQRDRVELLIRARRHVTERLLRCLVVLHQVLDGRLEVEGFDEGRLLEDHRVADGAHLDAVGLRPNREFRVLAHAALDNLGDVLQRGAILPLLVVAQPDGVGQLRLEAGLVHRLLELDARLLEHGGVAARLRRLLVEHARLVDECICLLGGALLDKRLRIEKVIHLVADGRLQQEHFRCKLDIVADVLARLHRRLVQARLEKRLSVVKLVLVHLWA